MSEVLFKVNGHDYRATPLSAFQALDVATRLALPLMALSRAQKAKATPEIFTRTLVATMSQVNSTAIHEGMDICMSVVQRQQGQGWAAIRSAPQQMMFQDISLPEMMEIAWRVMEANRLPDFFDVPLGEEEQEPKT